MSHFHYRFGREELFSKKRFSVRGICIYVIDGVFNSSHHMLQRHMTRKYRILTRVTSSDILVIFNFDCSGIN